MVIVLPHRWWGFDELNNVWKALTSTWQKKKSLCVSFYYYFIYICMTLFIIQFCVFYYNRRKCIQTPPLSLSFITLKSPQITLLHKKSGWGRVENTFSTWWVYFWKPCKITYVKTFHPAAKKFNLDVPNMPCFPMSQTGIFPRISPCLFPIFWLLLAY